MKKRGLGVRSRTVHGVMGALGYLLSPLSWWNDALVNIPLAYVFASVLALFAPKAFTGALVAGYWLTNVAGLVLLHRGAAGFLCKEPPCQYTRGMFAKDLAISLLYTVAVAALAWTGLLVPPQELARWKAGL